MNWRGKNYLSFLLRHRFFKKCVSMINYLWIYSKLKNVVCYILAFVHISVMRDQENPMEKQQATSKHNQTTDSYGNFFACFN